MMPKKLLFAFLIAFLSFGCKQKIDEETDFSVSAATAALLLSTEKNVTDKGPIAWLDVFENSPDFHMTSNGRVIFNGYASADKFIKDTLVKIMPRLTLQFSKVKITTIDEKTGIVEAFFDEKQTDEKGKVTPIYGHFKATAHLGKNEWRYINMEWSTAE